jgi:PAS domain S-box-containing protein
MNDLNKKWKIINTVTIVFLLSLIIPFSAYLTEIIANDYAFNLQSILRIHKLNKSLYVLDLVPPLVTVVAYFISQMVFTRYQGLMDTIGTHEHKIKLTLEFINKLVEGNTNTDFKIEDGDDKLGQSLVSLRDNIIENKKIEDKRRKEDEQRNWVAEGLAKFGDILRQGSDNMEELSYTIIVNLVRYTSSNQGGFYILEDNDHNDRHFVQTACYAYDRKKFSDRRIEWGEGLIGTCALEKQTVFLKDVPDSYLNITSGLGKANPRCVLLVPLLINDGIHGVMELASFNVYEDYQVNFIEKVAESIASTISTVKINVRTAKLLSESREQADVLASQEEQMRQNMEELQATQEEAARQADKFISFTNSVNHTLIRAEYDTDGTLLYANTKFLKKLGYQGNSEVEGKHISMFINEKDRDWFFKIWDNLEKGGRHFEGDMKHVTKQGNDLWTMATYTCVRREDGSVEKILFLAIDTTDQKKQSLDFEGQIEALNITNIKVEYDPDGSFLSCNELFLQCLKYTLAEIKNKAVYDFIDRTDLDIFRENWENVVHGIPFQGLIKMLTKLGDEKWLRVSLSPVNNMYGEVAKIVFLATDITNEKLMELEMKKQTDQLKEQEEKLRQASIELNQKLNEARTEMKQQFREIENAKVRSERTLEGALDSIITFDVKGEISFFNRAAEELWAMSRKDTLGKNINILFSEQTIEDDVFVNKMVNAAKGKIIGERREVNILTSNGEEKPVLILLSDATVDNEHSFTAFIQNIEVELF